MAEPAPPATANLGDREDADIETSSDDYTRRFAGSVGRWFLEVQTRTTLDLLADLPPGSTILDVGGGHAQLAPHLAAAGYRVTVAGSTPACGARLAGLVSQGRCSFEVADLRTLPYEKGTFTAVTCFRLLPHSTDWQRLVGELCRVARVAVVTDYPSKRSVNAFAEGLFLLKRRVEQNTRPFALFHPAEIAQALARHGFAVRAPRPQFLLPMVLHRMVQSAGLSRAAEWPLQLVGLTRLLGSPVIVRADRIP